jgi:hypothetical protein
MLRISERKVQLQGSRGALALILRKCGRSTLRSKGRSLAVDLLDDDSQRFRKLRLHGKKLGALVMEKIEHYKPGDKVVQTAPPGHEHTCDEVFLIDSYF